MGSARSRLTSFLVQQLDMLVADLRASATPRTVWLDPYGRLWHGAPTQPPPHARWKALGTFTRPTADDLVPALGLAH